MSSSICSVYSHSRNVVLFTLVTLLVLSSLVAIPARAQDEQYPVGAVITDVTAESSCVIDTEETINGVMSQWQESCPAGSVLQTTPVFAEAELLQAGGVFVPFSGDFASDMATVDAAKLQLMPHSSGDASIAACTVRNGTRSLSFNASGVRVYAQVQYWQDVDCSSGLGSNASWLSASNDVFWAKSKYYGTSPVTERHHNCTQLTTYPTWSSMVLNAPLGYLYVEEVRDVSYNYCQFALSTSYTGSVYV